MTIIHRYISRLFFKYFAVVLLMVIVIYLSIDVFGRMDDLMEAGRSLPEMLLFFAYKVPLIISQVTPAAVLLGVLIVFGIMSKNNEIIALKSAGVSLQYLLLPILLIGLLLSFGLFVFSEGLVPITTTRANALMEEKGDARQVMRSREKNIWLKQHRSITNIQYYHPSEKVIHGVSAMFFDTDFHLIRRLDADRGIYRNGRWVLFSGMLQRLEPGSDEHETDFFDEKPVDLGFSPEDLKKVSRSAEEMSFSRLRQYVQKVAQEGYDATHYKVDLYAKTAFPAVCLIMGLVGAAVALRGKTREGMAVSFGYGIITAFIYWSLYSFSLSLGYGGILPPFWAAWIVNLVFFCAAALMVFNLE